MLGSGWGRIVVVASVVAKRGEPQVAAYTAAKHGVLGLVRAAAAELARTGVTVNAVCPGYVDTPMTEQTVADVAERTGRTPEEARAVLAHRQPIGRFIEPAEVAEAVRFCVVNGAVTGQGINVDGGTVQS
jgi:NAD(P)-dependent dehydrogenase (short-subunit alcohol dehydrogenase family)